MNEEKITKKFLIWAHNKGLVEFLPDLLYDNLAINKTQTQVFFILS